MADSSRAAKQKQLVEDGPAATLICRHYQSLTSFFINWPPRRRLLLRIMFFSAAYSRHVYCVAAQQPAAPPRVPRRAAAGGVVLLLTTPRPPFLLRRLLWLGRAAATAECAKARGPHQILPMPAACGAGSFSPASRRVDLLVGRRQADSRVVSLSLTSTEEETPNHGGSGRTRPLRQPAPPGSLLRPRSLIR